MNGVSWKVTVSKSDTNLIEHHGCAFDALTSSPLGHLRLFSYSCVDWSMANHLRTRLVLDALDMALRQRRPDGVIHHSDRDLYA